MVFVYEINRVVLVYFMKGGSNGGIKRCNVIIVYLYFK